MEKTVIVQGSSRSDGNTSLVVNYLSDKKNIDIIDLCNKNIGHFEYDFRNKDDDFLPLMRNIIEKYDTIIFATPVYWYAMSGVLKVFFDRISDLLYQEKELGRKLRGKRMGMVSCGSDSNLLSEFSIPFTSSAAYLGMTYVGDVHTWIEGASLSKKVKDQMDDFLSKFSTFD